ncbi:hypothetical protein CORC01_01224 [Colletotrichum orchidophilum]|uniref:Uncharacterized protein n=1 Tax=Colletotrichum orchidophilum TaxID=1209926 RepID=A0A1G4BQ96_9PEZI|nr:uncharacterized protein CORC01_01224 [Colletotrichum orchidophilum]OHF03505.1 hypothetical protein CORC01_01224 [Colletotrichum orchidophilum]
MAARKRFGDGTKKPKSRQIKQEQTRDQCERQLPTRILETWVSPATVLAVWLVAMQRQICRLQRVQCRGGADSQQIGAGRGQR